MRLLSLTRASCALAALAALTFAQPAAPASAHTALSGSSPADGAEVPSAEEVVLTFNEDVRTAQLVIQDAAEKNAHKGRVKVDGNEVTRALRAGLGPGEYTVGYRVISADGHPVTGSLSFTLTVGSPAAPAGSATPPPATAAPATTAASPAASSDGSGTTRWLMVGAGLAAGAGLGLLFTMRRRRDA